MLKASDTYPDFCEGFGVGDGNVWFLTDLFVSCFVLVNVLFIFKFDAV